MPEYNTAIILFAAFAMDALAGDPQYAFHPVRLAGKTIAAVERVCFQIGLKNRFGGFCMTMAVIAAAVSAYLMLRLVFLSISPFAAVGLDIYIVYSAFALKDLFQHAMPVARALEKDDIAGARRNVNMMVGRDCQALDRHAIARASVESVAENFVDSFFAPVCWFTAGVLLSSLFGFDPTATGAVTLIVYRMTNTLDAMIGYRDSNYEKFGTFAAKLDDALNFIPARLSLLALIPAAFIIRLDYKEGTMIFFRDRLKHESPNSAHAESFAAGALGLRLGGPTRYPRGIVDKPWLGNGTQQAEPSHIRKICAFMAAAGWITLIIAVIIVFL